MRGSLKNWLSAWGVPVIAALALEASVSQARLSNCEQKLLGNGRAYPASVDPRTQPDGHFMYGLEVEYSYDLIQPALLEHFCPTPDLIPRDVWLEQLTAAQRVEWVKAHTHELFPQGFKKPGNLVNVTGDALLPETLILDETGNLEFVSQPFDTWSDFLAYLHRVKATYGEGYVQASISEPGDHIYHTALASDAFIGYRFAIGELDLLEKLEKGFAAHQANPAYIPAKSFTHPYLGPMTSTRANFMRQVVHQNRRGRFDADVLERISALNASYKYTSAIAYRPDIIKNRLRFINEVRDCVKDFDCIEQRLRREQAFLSGELFAFAPFEGVRHLDPVADFALLPEKVVMFLIKAFPPHPDEGDDGSELLAAETYRNFAYPLQDWDSWFTAMGYVSESPEYQTVKSTQENYLMALNQIADQLARQTLTIEQAGKHARIELARFVHESRLTQVLDHWFKSHVSAPVYAQIKKAQE